MAVEVISTASGGGGDPMISDRQSFNPISSEGFFHEKTYVGILMVVYVPLYAQDVSVFVERSLQFEAVIVDQFNNPMPTQGGYEYDWSATGGTLSAVSGSNVMYMLDQTQAIMR